MGKLTRRNYSCGHLLHSLVVTKPGVSRNINWVSPDIPIALALRFVVWTLLDVEQICNQTNHWICKNFDSTFNFYCSVILLELTNSV